jgi:hypothetical protein
VSIPDFDQDGLLPAGVHEATWEEVRARFGHTAHRRRLLAGLEKALAALHTAGCERVLLDGSFVTDKERPEDFDACWEEAGVDLAKIDPTLLDFTNKRARQKARFRGELFPASAPANPAGSPFEMFFRTDRATGREKGIVSIDLKRWNK